jgi:AGZA family xanthine/uracil permease-like MFS transporter
VTARARPRWYAPGDWNAFFALALDNLTQLVILSGLLIGLFGFPADLVLRVMVPGTAAGVLLGDLAYSALAVRLMRRTGRADVTAMPFGIDTPSLFGMVFGVLGPAKLATGDPVLAWKIGMAVTVAMGAVKLGLAWSGDWVRRAVPRAALLGSIAGVAILLIAFLPSLKIFADPWVGLLSLTLVLAALAGGVRMPFGVPGALFAVIAATALFWGRSALGFGPPPPPPAWSVGWSPPWPTLAWLGVLDAALPYLPLALPFAVATVIGGIDNTESAVVAGDEYRTRDILLTEAAATVGAGLLGGVVQNTPYIGHPAYKAMGARAGYTVATALVIGVGAAVGVVSLLVSLLPEAAVAPILVFIGLSITAQAFLASPGRHAMAVAVALVPAVAQVVLIQANLLISGLGKTAADLTGPARAGFETLLLVGNGFVLTALLWGSIVAWVIDGRVRAAAGVMLAAATATLVGAIHSPLDSGAVFWPWAPPGPAPPGLAGAYALAALALAAVAPRRRGRA